MGEARNVLGLSHMDYKYSYSQLWRLYLAASGNESNFAVGFRQFLNNRNVSLDEGLLQSLTGHVLNEFRRLYEHRLSLIRDSTSPLKRNSDDIADDSDNKRRKTEEADSSSQMQLLLPEIFAKMREKLASEALKSANVSDKDTFGKKQGVELIPRVRIPAYSGDPATPPQPARDLGGLYLGNVEVAYNSAWQDYVEIEAVVNAANDLGTIDYHQRRVFALPLVDEDETRLEGPSFDNALDFIDDQRNAGKNVLVHCFMGQSRSVSTVTLYMIKRCLFTLKQCLDIFKSKGVKITIKLGMRKSLMEADKLTHGANSHDYFNTRTRQAKLVGYQKSLSIQRDSEPEELPVNRRKKATNSGSKNTAKPTKSPDPRQPRLDDMF